MGPLTTISVLPRTAHRRGRFRKERKPQPDRKRPRLRSGKRTRLSYRSGDRRTTGPDPRDTVRPPRPARRTPETSRRNVLRRCPFHKYPKRLPFPTEERPPHRTRKTPRRPPAQTSGRTETPRHRHAEPLRGKGPPPHAQNGNKTGRRTAAPSYLHQNRNRRRRMAGRPQVPDRQSRKNDVPSAPPRQARSTQGTPSVPREVPVRPIAGYSPAMKSFISRSRASRRCNRRNCAHERCRLWVGCRIL